MRALAVGTRAIYPAPNHACAGWLLESGKDRILLDCGSGVVAALAARYAWSDIAAILVSHAHADHWLDVIMLRQARVYEPGIGPVEPLPVYAAPETAQTMEAVALALTGKDGFLMSGVELREFDPIGPLSVAGFEVTFCATEHYVPCYAMRVRRDGCTIVYTADTGPSAAVTDFARDADLLVAECTLADGSGDDDDWGHLTPRQVGEMAAAAAVDRLVLTHYFAEYGVEQLRCTSAKAYGGEVLVAEEGEWYDCE